VRPLVEVAAKAGPAPSLALPTFEVGYVRKVAIMTQLRRAAAVIALPSGFHVLFQKEEN
jgi:hypothetical protein